VLRSNVPSRGRKMNPDVRIALIHAATKIISKGLGMDTHELSTEEKEIITAARRVLLKEFQSLTSQI
jgi:hypothetical protein